MSVKFKLGRPWLPSADTYRAKLKGWSHEKGDTEEPLIRWEFEFKAERKTARVVATSGATFAQGAQLNEIVQALGGTVPTEAEIEKWTPDALVGCECWVDLTLKRAEAGLGYAWLEVRRVRPLVEPET